MTTLIYKFSTEHKGAKRNLLRLSSYKKANTQEFEIRLPQGGRLILCDTWSDSKDGRFRFNLKDIKNGAITPKAIIDGKTYIADAVLIDGDEIIPTTAGADAVIALSERVCAAEDKLAELTAAINALSERIGSGQVLKII